MLALPNPNQAAQNGSGIFSSSCFWHCTSVDQAFWGIHIQGLSLQSYLGMWLLGDDVPYYGVPTRVIETCTGFDCGQCVRGPGDRGRGKRQRLAERRAASGGGGGAAALRAGATTTR